MVICAKQYEEYVFVTLELEQIQTTTCIVNIVKYVSKPFQPALSKWAHMWQDL